jgi:hypothetical protein
MLEEGDRLTRLDELLTLARADAGEARAPAAPPRTGSASSSASTAWGDFFGKPAPKVRPRRIGRAWHLGKVLFERWWLTPFGVRRRALGLAFELGAKAHGVPIALIRDLCRALR